MSIFKSNIFESVSSSSGGCSSGPTPVFTHDFSVDPTGQLDILDLFSEDRVYEMVFENVVTEKNGSFSASVVIFFVNTDGSLDFSGNHDFAEKKFESKFGNETVDSSGDSRVTLTSKTIKENTPIYFKVYLSGVAQNRINVLGWEGIYEQSNLGKTVNTSGIASYTTSKIHKGIRLKVQNMIAGKLKIF